MEEAATTAGAEAVEDNKNKQKFDVYKRQTITMCTMGDGQRFNARQKLETKHKGPSTITSCDRHPLGINEFCRHPIECQELFYLT